MAISFGEWLITSIGCLAICYWHQAFLKCSGKLLLTRVECNTLSRNSISEHFCCLNTCLIFLPSFSLTHREYIITFAPSVLSLTFIKWSNQFLPPQSLQLFLVHAVPQLSGLQFAAVFRSEVADNFETYINCWRW